MPTVFDVTNWYWFIDGDTSRVFSSAISNYVAVDDPAYSAWKSTTGHTTRSGAGEDITNLLDSYGIIGPIVRGKYVDKEAYRRISEGFSYGGHLIQMRQEKVDYVEKDDQINICAQSQLAHAAIVSGAMAGDYTWCKDLVPFAWRCADNFMLPLDAFQMVDLADAAARWKRLNTWAASTLKSNTPTPLDFRADHYWPQ